ncbi:MAG: hypothetical protein U0414_03915 [Polyangiaceae bacterium]
MKTTGARGLLAAVPFVGFALIVFGCSQASSSTTGAGTTTATSTASSPQTKASDGSGDSVGAPECDEVLKLASSPECKEKPGIGPIVANRDNWRNGLANAATKDGTLQACKGAMEAIKAVGCAGGSAPGSGSASAPAGSGSAAVGSADSTGAPECDDVLRLAATDNCKDKPGVSAILAQKSAFKTGVSFGASKDATIQACKAAMQTLKTVGCDVGGAGGTPAAGSDAWDGKSPYSCSGNADKTITGVTANITKGPAITASGNCKVTFKDCSITTDEGVVASGNATVNLEGGELKASGKAIDATGNAHVFVKGAKVSGKVTTSGNGKVDGVPTTP